MGWLIILVVVGTTIWVGLDAGNRAGRGIGLAGSMRPWQWVLGCLLLWIVVFPWYLVQRSSSSRLRPRPSVGVPTRSASTPPLYGIPPEESWSERGRMQSSSPGFGVPHNAASGADARSLTYTSPQTQPPPNGLASELERLSKLREQGHLTADEFAAHKARLLTE
jgi:hypothetical protein